MKTLFEDAVGVAPPSTVDVDRLIARRKRIQWLHRTGLAVTAVIAAGAATLLVPGGGTVTPGATVSASRAQTPAQRAARLTTALRAILAERAPGVTVTAVEPSQFRHVVRQSYGRRDTAEAPPADHYEWPLTLSDAAGSGQLMIGIDNELAVGTQQQRSIRAESMKCRAPSVNGESCQQSTGPNGERITRRVVAMAGAVPPDMWNIVVIARPDATSVALTATDCGHLGNPPPPSRAEPVLTLDQLIAIGTDPRLAW